MADPTDSLGKKKNRQKEKMNVSEQEMGTKFISFIGHVVFKAQNLFSVDTPYYTNNKHAMSPPVFN